MIPSPGADQSVETMTLKGHTWKRWWILYWGPPLRPPLNPQLLKALGTEKPAHFPLRAHWCLSHSPLLSPRCFILYFSLSPKRQGPFFCLYNLFSEPISSTAHFFYLCDFLNKLSLIDWILALNYFLSRTQEPRLLNLGLTLAATSPLTFFFYSFI